jgi:class III cytochrome C family protein
MKNSIAVLVIILMIVMMTFLTAYSQEDMEVVDNSVFGNPVRGPAVFVHDEHNEQAELEDCNICHHVYEDGVLLEYDSSEDQSCSECHAINASGDNHALRKAFHLNCKGCHLQTGSGPVMCGECHVAS